MIYKNGDTVQHGDVISWYVWDSDDCKVWKFIGIYKTTHVLYLTGGLDFGAAIGKQLNIEDVMNQSENNDEGFQGIEKVGTYQDFAKHIFYSFYPNR